MLAVYTVWKVPFGKHRSRCSCHALCAVLTFSSLMWNSTAKRFSIWAVTRLPNLSCHAGITVAGTVGFSAYSVSYSRFIQYIRMRWTLAIHLIAFFRQVYQKVHLLVSQQKNILHSLLPFGCLYPIIANQKKQPILTKTCRKHERFEKKYFVESFTKRCTFW